MATTVSLYMQTNKKKLSEQMPQGNLIETSQQASIH